MSLPEKPLTRREVYLAKATGQAVTLPETDLTREEQYLRAIAEGGGGGGTSPFYPAGNTAFASLPELSADILGAMYNITDAFTTDSRFNEGAGVDYPAGTNVAVVNVGTAESPVLKYDTFAGAYVVDNALSDASENPVQNKVIKSALDGKATPADIAALIDDTTAAQNKAYSSAKVEEKVVGEEITTTATGSDLTLSTAEGNINALTVYGKSEVVDGSIKSAGEGYAVVDLGTLTWTYQLLSNDRHSFITSGITALKSSTGGDAAFPGICDKYKNSFYNDTWVDGNISYANASGNKVVIIDNAYSDATTFKSAMSGVLLYYEEASPTNNTIAVKTDNGTGINGTMATFTTGTPLRGIPNTSVRDVMAWNGSAGTVTKNCASVDLSTSEVTWNLQETYDNRKLYYVYLGATVDYSANYLPEGNFTRYDSASQLTDPYRTATSARFNALYVTIPVDADISIMDGIHFLMKLATPTTTPFTATENASIAGLRTFTPQTHAQNNAGATMTVEAYAGTGNGKAVQELEGQIDKITVELTQAEYDALTEEEKNNGTIYFITDAPSGITIDSELSTTSTNAVQNRVITSQVNKILSEAEIQAQINDRIYQGTDLTVKFASEISASPYNGNPWAWIKARIQSENFTGIHINDYIPFTTTNAITLNAQIAGINTYKNYGDSPVGAHIDFICKELWPTRHPVNKVNYNNGTSAQNHPWLASDLYLYLNSLSGDVPNGTVVNPETVAVDYTADGVYYFLPTQLKNVIIEKKFLLPARYSASGLLSNDNSRTWKNIGKLWLPDECEVYGVPVWGGKGGYSICGSGLQYPLFAGNMNRLKFKNGSRAPWWLLSPYSGNSTYWCHVSNNGNCAYNGTADSDINAPVCFRVG